MSHQILTLFSKCVSLLLCVQVEGQSLPQDSIVFSQKDGTDTLSMGRVSSWDPHHFECPGVLVHDLAGEQRIWIE